MSEVILLDRHYARCPRWTSDRNITLRRDGGESAPVLLSRGIQWHLGDVGRGGAAAGELKLVGTDAQRLDK